MRSAVALARELRGPGGRRGGVVVLLGQQQQRRRIHHHPPPLPLPSRNPHRSGIHRAAPPPSEPAGTPSLLALAGRRRQQHERHRGFPARAIAAERMGGGEGSRRFATGSGGIDADDGSSPALVIVSPITETPLDSAVMEKPYTLVLMEDDSSDFFVDPPDDEETVRSRRSWAGAFRARIPRDHGMSFASASLRLRSAARVPTRDPLAPVADGLRALKESDLSAVGDAILVARGPVASLVAQYYLESFSLKGLVMIDPILLRDENDEHDDEGVDSVLTALVDGWYPGDEDSADRFRSRRLLVEPNSVPMLVVHTRSDDDDDDDDGVVSAATTARKRAAIRVAERHGDPDGPYGKVPVLEFVGDPDLNDLPDRIEGWIDKTL